MDTHELTLTIVGILFPIGAIWMVHRIRYSIDDDAVRVRLGKVTLRKIAIADIEFADTAAPCWNEHWCNTFFAKGRVVRLRRKTGWFRNFIVTPADRERFLGELLEKMS